jgi:hypothetical protein
MWRSFFYAVGIGLFLMGGQALVTDHVVVPKDTRLQKLITKVLSDGESKSADNPVVQATATQPYQAQYGQFPNAGQFPNPGSGLGGNYAYNSGSRFGPSRFSGPTYGDYGNGPGNFGQQAQNGFLSGSQNQFGNQPQTPAQLAAYRGVSSTENARPKVAMQKFRIREWMPWSLLAAGAIIFLYTHSLNGRHASD